MAGVAVTSAMGADLPARIAFSGKPGLYDVAAWRRDWPGCDFEGGVRTGRLALTERRDGERWLRVNFSAGEIGPETGGAGWRWPVGSHESAEVSYALRFSPDFQFVKGGKLPGLCGGPENVSGGRPANGQNGFSARLMWRRDGRGEAYVYHKNQRSDYGDSFPFPDDFRFPQDQDVRVRLRVTMNDPGNRNGILRVWVALEGKPEQLMVENTEMEWRSVSSFGVDGVYFEAFYGGGDASWAPKGKNWVEFGRFEVRE